MVMITGRVLGTLGIVVEHAAAQGCTPIDQKASAGPVSVSLARAPSVAADEAVGQRSHSAGPDHDATTSAGDVAVDGAAFQGCNAARTDRESGPRTAKMKGRRGITKDAAVDQRRLTINE